MGTRSTTHFIDSTERNKPIIVYRHWDGNPEVAGVDLLSFLDHCKPTTNYGGLEDTQLAAKYVVFLAEIYAVDDKYRNKVTGEMVDTPPRPSTSLYEYISVPRKDRLDFLSVYIMREDPTDIEYRYVVDCGKLEEVTRRPLVTCYNIKKRKFVEIPQVVEVAWT